MKKRRMPRFKGNSMLILDPIYESDDPGIQDFIGNVMLEEMDKAQERAQIRIAYKYKFMLSPKMQAILEATYPKPEEGKNNADGVE